MKTYGGVRDREDVFDSVKVQRFVSEFKLRRGLIDSLSQFFQTVIWKCDRKSLACQQCELSLYMTHVFLCETGFLIFDTLLDFAGQKQNQSIKIVDPIVSVRLECLRSFLLKQ